MKNFIKKIQLKIYFHVVKLISLNYNLASQNFDNFIIFLKFSTDIDIKQIIYKA